MTDNKNLEKADRKQAQVEHATHLSAGAKRIKLADKMANVQDVLDCPPAHWSMATRIEYVEWTKQVVAGCRGANLALEKLCDDLVARAQAELR